MPAKQVPLIVINGLLALLLFYYASLQVPVAGLFISALMPLPTLMTIRRAGWLAGLLLIAAGVGMMYYVEHFTGIKAEVFPFLHMAVIGFGVAFFTARRRPLEVVVGGTAVVSAVLQVGVFLFLAWQQGLTPMAYLQRLVEDWWQAFTQLVAKEQLLEQEIRLSGLNLAELASVIVQVTPALLLINNVLIVLLNYMISQSLGGEPREENPNPPLTCWEAPGWLVFVLIAAGFCLLVPQRIVQMTGVNVLLVCALIYFFQGLAILVYSFRRFQVPWFFRWTAYLLLIFLKPAMFVVMLMGLIDLWLDFRQLHRPPSEI